MTDTTGIFHKFRSLSELTNESKGGYIDWEFHVQTGIKTIEFGVYFISKFENNFWQYELTMTSSGKNK